MSNVKALGRQRTAFAFAAGGGPAGWRRVALWQVSARTSCLQSTTPTQLLPTEMLGKPLDFDTRAVYYYNKSVGNELVGFVEGRT
jgi:hypothetical protein